VKFTYAYKTSDGIRHEEAMEASSRDEVFAALRERGIRAIKVVAADGSKANGERRGIRKRVAAAVVLAVALGVGAVAYVGGVRASGGSAKGRAAMRAAAPLARQAIPGDRARIARIPDDLFANDAERFLARYAEPGRRVMPDGTAIPSDEAFVAALDHAILCADDEFTEYVDLKRMVVKMKAELRAYLAGGGTVGGYVAALKDRQKTECEHRDGAEKRLRELVKTSDEGAYAYWLKANARLQSMGIYPLQLPEALREYQSNLELDE